MPRTKSEKSHAEKQQSEEKLHGDALDTAVSSAGEHSAQESTGHKQDSTDHKEDQAARQSAIPTPDDGGHRRSQAAHLGGHTRDHTKPVGDMRKYEAEREPPQEVSRAGKEYRRQ